MRLLVITALYPPALGGAATYFGEICPRLARCEGIDELTILTEKIPGQPTESREDGARLLRYLPARVGIQSRFWLEHAATYALTQVWFSAFLPGLAKRHGVDLVHYHTRYRGRLFYSALGRCGAALVADLRDKMTDPRSMLGSADRLLCCGEGIRRFAVENGFPVERTALIPNAFRVPDIPSAERVARARDRYALGSRYLLYVGDMTYNKGVFDLLDAYGRWRRRYPDVRIAFVGLNREGTRFEERVSQTEGATLVGELPHGDVLALMRGAQIVALPSRSEGLPTVILEALALGRKVICPPGIPEFERWLPGYVLPEVSADAITTLLTDVWHREDTPTYPFAQHDAGRVVADLAGLYRSVMEGQRSH